MPTPRQRLVISRLILISTLALATIWVAPQTAHACSCMMPEAGLLFENADAAFEGTVLRAPEQEGFGGEMVEYVFAVDEAYKGDLTEEVIVRTADNSAACGLSMTEGGSAALFVYDSGGDWNGDLCSTMSSGALAEAGYEPIAIVDGPSPSDETASASNTARWVLGAGVGVAAAAFVASRRRSSTEM